MTLLLALALGAGLVAGGPSAVAEESARERVEQLMPRLQSDDDAVRERAEKELFGLGEPGRREMERLSRDTDTRRALTALRYLNSGRWDEGRLRDGEQKLRRADDSGTGSLEDLERKVDRRFEEIRKRLEELTRGIPDFEMPDLPEIDLSPDAEAGSITLHGTVIRGDHKLSWQRAADGKVRVTRQIGDGAEQVFEADDMEAFRKSHPDVANELDEVVPSWTGAPTIRVLDQVPDIRIPPSVWRWFHDEDDVTDQPGDRETTDAQRPMLGIQWGPVSPLLRHHLRLDGTGVVVESVVPRSLAARLGMEPMDVLVELAGRAIRGRADIGAALQDAGDQPVDAVVIRRGERKTLRLPE
jgi:hypothetical protein